MSSQKPCYLCSKTTIWQTESGISICSRCALNNNISTIKLISLELEKEEPVEAENAYDCCADSEDSED